MQLILALFIVELHAIRRWLFPCTMGKQEATQAYFYTARDVCLVHREIFEELEGQTVTLEDSRGMKYMA